MQHFTRLLHRSCLSIPTEQLHMNIFISPPSVGPCWLIQLPSQHMVSSSVRGPHFQYWQPFTESVCLNSSARGQVEGQEEDHVSAFHPESHPKTEDVLGLGPAPQNTLNKFSRCQAPRPAENACLLPVLRQQRVCVTSQPLGVPALGSW
ncbi:uncharacterized protein [Symphalangus syndactylus]|uniref:uncharacterized protein isoform X2 n=1 Tax=Symphalangus syndactylus TaxID=9590 RepID=UPI00300482A1